ncbi:MAG: hypothetical protein V4568_15720, partial [Pseudomonadota bacterium]
MVSLSKARIRLGNPVVFGFAILLGGAAALLGWALNIPTLFRIHTTGIPISINSAICFMLGGASLAIPAGLPARRRAQIVFVLAGAVTLIAVAELTEIIFGVSFGIDLDDVQRPFHTSVRYPGQMAPNSALGFLLAGIALICANCANNSFARRTVRFLTFSVLFIGVTGGIAYFINLQFLYSWHGVKRMSLITLPPVTFKSMSIRLQSRY